PAGTMSRSPGYAAETTARRRAAYPATSARSGRASGRGAQPERTNRRNSSVVRRDRLSTFACSSLTRPWSHAAPTGTVRAYRSCRSEPVNLEGQEQASMVGGRSGRWGPGRRAAVAVLLWPLAIALIGLGVLLSFIDQLPDPV